MVEGPSSWGEFSQVGDGQIFGWWGATLGLPPPPPTPPSRENSAYYGITEVSIIVIFEPLSH